MTRSIEELTQEHPNEWLAIEVTRANGEEPLEGVLLEHDPDFDALCQQVTLSKEKMIAFLFTGPDLPEGSDGFLL